MFVLVKIQSRTEVLRFVRVRDRDRENGRHMDRNTNMDGDRDWDVDGDGDRNEDGDLHRDGGLYVQVTAIRFSVSDGWSNSGCIHTFRCVKVSI